MDESELGELEQAEQSAARVHELSILTWNVWFNEQDWFLRCRALLGHVQRVRPHMACFQEVTPRFLEQLAAADWVRAEYAISDAGDEGTLLPYGVVMIARVPVRRFVIFDMASTQNRKLVLAELTVNGTRVTFASMHLESHKRNTHLRAWQRRAVASALRTLGGLADLVLFAGDMNVHDVWPESAD